MIKCNHNIVNWRISDEGSMCVFSILFCILFSSHNETKLNRRTSDEESVYFIDSFLHTFSSHNKIKLNRRASDEESVYFIDSFLHTFSSHNKLKLYRRTSDEGSMCVFSILFCILFSSR